MLFFICIVFFGIKHVLQIQIHTHAHIQPFTAEQREKREREYARGHKKRNIMRFVIFSVCRFKYITHFRRATCTINYIGWHWSKAKEFSAEFCYTPPWQRVVAAAPCGMCIEDFFDIKKSFCNTKYLWHFDLNFLYSLRPGDKWNIFCFGWANRPLFERVRCIENTPMGSLFFFRGC